MRKRNQKYKPRGFQAVSPYLIVDGAEETMEFLKRVFNAIEIRTIFMFDFDRVYHCEVMIDDTVIVLTDPPEGMKALPAHVLIYVPDVDATYKRALEEGAEPLQEPIRLADPAKRGAFRDKGGTIWRIATQVG